MPKTQSDLVKESAEEVVKATSEMEDASRANDVKRIRAANERVQQASGYLSTELIRFAQYSDELR